jgi:hypothetical protein
MARVPVIETPCPIANRPLPVGAADHCTQCDRTVHNLDRMSESQRRAFMSACSGKVCVAYTVQVPVPLRRRALGAAALAAATLAALPVAAQESPVVGRSPISDPNGLQSCDDEWLDMVVTGGVNKGDHAEWTDDGKDAPPDLPAMEDDGK